MTLPRLTLALVLATAACSADLLGPTPGPDPHFTATVDGSPFLGQLAPGGCIGTQITATLFFLDVRVAGTFPTSEISIHLGGITGPGRFPMRPNEVQEAQRAALYIPDDPARLQYSAPTERGEVIIDEYDPVARTLAGRFFFKGYRVVGTEGPEWVDVRQGSFRGRLRAWGALQCLEP